jgi:hypothetical protein
MADAVRLDRPEDVVTVLAEWRAGRVPGGCRRRPVPMLTIDAGAEAPTGNEGCGPAAIAAPVSTSVPAFPEDAA